MVSFLVHICELWQHIFLLCQRWSNSIIIIIIIKRKTLGRWSHAIIQWPITILCELSRISFFLCLLLLLQPFFFLFLSHFHSLKKSKSLWSSSSVLIQVCFSLSLSLPFTVPIGDPSINFSISDFLGFILLIGFWV